MGAAKAVAVRRAKARAGSGDFMVRGIIIGPIGLIGPIGPMMGESRLLPVPRHIAQHARAIVLERMGGRLDAGGEGALGELLEVEQAGVAPFAGVEFLAGEALLHVRETLGVDVVLERLPGALQRADLAHALLVAEAELVPERAAGLHLMIPRHMVEPEQQVLRAGIEVAPELLPLGRILGEGVGAGGGAIEAEALGVGFVIVDGSPVGAGELVDPRAWTVVMAFR